MCDTERREVEQKFCGASEHQEVRCWLLCLGIIDEENLFRASYCDWSRVSLGCVGGKLHLITVPVAMLYVLTNWTVMFDGSKGRNFELV